jgi:hypothetical protein
VKTDLYGRGLTALAFLETFGFNDCARRGVVVLMRFFGVAFGDARAQRRHVGVLLVVVRAAQRKSDAVGACIFAFGVGWSDGGGRYPAELLLWSDAVV